MRRRALVAAGPAPGHHQPRFRQPHRQRRRWHPGHRYLLQVRSCEVPVCAGMCAHLAQGAGAHASGVVPDVATGLGREGESGAAGMQAINTRCTLNGVCGEGSARHVQQQCWPHSRQWFRGACCAHIFGHAPPSLRCRLCRSNGQRDVSASGMLLVTSTLQAAAVSSGGRTTVWVTQAVGAPSPVAGARVRSACGH